MQEYLAFSFNLVPDLFFYIRNQFGIFSQKLLGVFPADAELVLAVTVTVAGFGDHAELDAGIYNVAGYRHAFIIHNVKFGVSKGGGHFIFNHFSLNSVADNGIAFFNLSGAPDFNSDRGIKFQGHAAGGGFGVAEKDADLHSNLIYKDNHRFGFADNAGKLSQVL